MTQCVQHVFLRVCVLSGLQPLCWQHAPNVPQCALAILDAFKEAGFPEGVYQNAFVDNDMAAQIIQHDAIQAVTFTGSTAGGAKVASLAGAAIKKTVLELVCSSFF